MKWASPFFARGVATQVFTNYFVAPRWEDVLLDLFPLCVGEIRILCVFLSCNAMLAQCMPSSCPSVWCGCSVPAAEWLDSSAMGIAQLVHTAASLFTAVRDGDAVLPKWLWGGLVMYCLLLSVFSLSCSSFLIIKLTGSNLNSSLRF